MTFDSFPPNCPPEDANDTNNDTVYRFIDGKHNAPKARDFESYAQLDRNFSCQGHGLSIFPTLESIAEMREEIPPMRKKRVAEGKLNEGMGKLKNTPGTVKDHHTWWLATDAPHQPEELFRLVKS